MTIYNALGEHLAYDTDAMGKQPKWVRLLVNKMASEIQELRGAASEPAPEETAVWRESPFSPGYNIPNKPIGDKRSVVIFGIGPDSGYHVRLVKGDLEVSLWSGQLSLHPTGGCNNIVIRRET